MTIEDNFKVPSIWTLRLAAEIVNEYSTSAQINLAFKRELVINFYRLDVTAACTLLKSVTLQKTRTNEKKESLKSAVTMTGINSTAATTTTKMKQTPTRDKVMKIGK